MRIRFTLKSKNRLKEIYQYYKDKSQGKYGRQIRAEIIKQALRLKDFPFLGREEEKLKHLGLGYRFLVKGNCKIIYRVKDNEVLILNIFDTRQDHEKLLE